jgi:hypothetical protein
MRARRQLAILVLIIPIVAVGWIVGATGALEALVAFEAPSYAKTSASELATLQSDQLATIVVNAMEKATSMNDLWHRTAIAYERMLYTLVAVIAALAVALAYLLWRVPSNPTVESDAGNNGPRASL